LASTSKSTERVRIYIYMLMLCVFLTSDGFVYLASAKLPSLLAGNLREREREFPGGLPGRESSYHRRKLRVAFAWPKLTKATRAN
jgi:hypothetical protein